MLDSQLLWKIALIAMLFIVVIELAIAPFDLLKREKHSEQLTSY